MYLSLASWSVYLTSSHEPLLSDASAGLWYWKKSPGSIGHCWHQSLSRKESVTSGHSCFENLTQLTLVAVCEDHGLDDWENSSEGAEDLTKGRRFSYTELVDLMSTVWDMRKAVYDVCIDKIGFMIIDSVCFLLRSPYGLTRSGVQIQLLFLLTYVFKKASHWFTAAHFEFFSTDYFKVNSTESEQEWGKLENTIVKLVFAKLCYSLTIILVLLWLIPNKNVVSCILSGFFSTLECQAANEVVC